MTTTDELRELLGPVGGEQDTVIGFRGMADADFVVDVAVRNGQVRKHQVGKI